MAGRRLLSLWRDRPCEPGAAVRAREGPLTARVNRRVLAATLLAPLLAPALYMAGSLAAASLDPLRRGAAFDNLWSSVLAVYVAGGPLAYAATLVALPCLWLIGHLSRRRGSGRAFSNLTLRRTVLVGFAIGAGLAWGLEPWLGRDLFRVPLPRWAGGAIGAATAAAWWWLAAPSLDSASPAAPAAKMR